MVSFLGDTAADDAVEGFADAVEGFAAVGILLLGPLLSALVASGIRDRGGRDWPFLTLLPDDDDNEEAETDDEDTGDGVTERDLVFV